MRELQRPANEGETRECGDDDTPHSVGVFRDRSEIAGARQHQIVCPECAGAQVDVRRDDQPIEFGLDELVD